MNEPVGLEMEPSSAGPGKGRGISVEGSIAGGIHHSQPPPPLSVPKGDVQAHFMMIFFSMSVLLSPQRNFSFHEINSV